MNKETLFNKILTQLCNYVVFSLIFPVSITKSNTSHESHVKTSFQGNSHLLKRWSFIFEPTAPRRATSVFLTFRVSHCIKLPGSPDRCHGGKMDHPIFDGRKTTCKCYWFWNFLFLMSKVPIKMGILMVSKIKFGEIWDFLCYECYLSLAEDTRFRTKLYVIVCIYIYILDPPPTQDARQCCSYIAFLGSGSPIILATVTGWGVHPIYDILYIYIQSYQINRLIKEVTTIKNPFLQKKNNPLGVSPAH